MKKNLLIVGGIINVLFGLFHIWLGRSLHLANGLTPPVQALLEMFNVSGALFIFFFAYASLFRRDELLATGLGKAVMIVCLLLYWARAAGEIVLFPGFSVAVFASCLIVGAIYLAVLVWPLKPAV